MSEPRIKSAAAFTTPDGREHSTWNAARKHLTGLDLLETLREVAPSLANDQLLALRDAVLASWNVSRRTAK